MQSLGIAQLFMHLAGCAVAAFIGVVAGIMYARRQQTNAFRKQHPLEQIFSSFLSNSPAPAFLEDGESRLIYVNPAFEEVLQVRAADVLGTSAALWAPPEVAAIIAEQNREVLKSGTASKRLINFPNRPNGELEPWLVVRFPVSLDRNRVVIGAFAINMASEHQRREQEEEIQILDDELKKRVYELAEMNAALQSARDQALEASSLKSAFVANISHELRTPLSGILGLNEILISNGNLHGDDLVLGNMIQDSAQSLLQVINDILDLSKIESGKIILEYARMSPRALVEDCASLMAPGARNQGLAFQVLIDENIPDVVFGDASRLRQILLNLIGNAIKFTDKGKVTVQAKVLELDDRTTKLCFSVADTGIGIGAQDQRYLFKPFVQVDNSSTRRFGGTGLGLAISRRYTEMMSGKLTVESERGKGAIFSVIMPFDRVKMHEAVEFGTEKIAKPAVEPIPAELAAGRCVLVVEDNQVLQHLALRQMSALGIEAVCTELGQEAINLAMSGEFEVVFMDINLPDMTGLDATGAIRNLEASAGRKPIPIIAMTAGAMRGDRERCLSAGMNDYLAKPVAIDALKYTLEKWLPPPSKKDVAA